MKLPDGYGSVIRLSRRRRKLTFTEICDLWCRYKFKGNPIKPVYVAAYKNLSALHDLTFSKIRKNPRGTGQILASHGGFWRTGRAHFLLHGFAFGRTQFWLYF